MIKLFISGEYYIVFKVDNLNAQIYCTNFSKSWNYSESASSLQSNFIDEIASYKNINNEDIEINLINSENFINIKVLKLKTDTIKIKLGEFKLLPCTEEKSLEKLFQIIFKEINILSEKIAKTEFLFSELEEENAKLRKNFKNLTESILCRENTLLNKACLLVNEKKRKIRELENELIGTSTKNQKIANETLDDNDLEEQDNDSSDCHSSLSCSFVKDDVIVVDNDNPSESKESSKPDFLNNNQAGNNSEDELFPETDNPKLTAVPMKIRVKENNQGIPKKQIDNNKLNEVNGDHNQNEKNLNYNQLSNLSSDNCISTDLFNQM